MNLLSYPASCGDDVQARLVKRTRPIQYAHYFSSVEFLKTTLKNIMDGVREMTRKKDMLCL